MGPLPEGDMFTSLAAERQWRLLDRAGIMRSLARRLKVDMVADNVFHFNYYANYFYDSDFFTGAIYKEYSKLLFPLLLSQGGKPYHVMPSPSPTPSPSASSSSSAVEQSSSSIVAVGA